MSSIALQNMHVQYPHAQFGRTHLISRPCLHLLWDEKRRSLVQQSLVGAYNQSALH